MDKQPQLVPEPSKVILSNKDNPKTCYLFLLKTFIMELHSKTYSLPSIIQTLRENKKQIE